MGREFVLYNVHQSVQRVYSPKPQLLQVQLVQNPFTLPVQPNKTALNKNIIPASLIAFGYHFEFKALQNLPCPCCDRVMTTQHEINRFSAEMGNATGNKIVAGMEKYRDRLPEIERDVADRIIATAKQNQNLRLDEILKKIQSEPKKQLEERQRKVLKEIQDLSQDLTGNTANRIKKDINVIDEIISEGKNGNPFKRKTLIHGLKKLTDTESDSRNKEILAGILKKAEEMPTSSGDVNAFIVKYSRRSPREIAYRILDPSTSTAEHIKPHSKKGKDGPENYLAECKRCNNDRGNIPFDEWLGIHPEMIPNTQKYMDEIINRISKGEIKGYDFYPQAVKKTLLQESKGLINLNIEKMDEFRKQKFSEQLKQKHSKQPQLAFNGGYKLNIFA